ncbi:MAG TPA: hypothetical protein VHZ55_21355 [Bryobacteraceae bacterium]|jgi:hypothetical protein|nr:hypothetical protein [Bryobacteraceae bacterium]
MGIRVWAVGLFLVVGFGLFTGILFLNAFGKHIELYTEFVNLDGLENGAKVRCLIRRWSCSMTLSRYLLDRTRTRCGTAPTDFSSAIALCEAA